MGDHDKRMVPCPIMGDSGCRVYVSQRHSIDHVHRCHWPILLHRFERCFYNMTHFVPKGQMDTHLQTCMDFESWKKENDSLGRPDFTWDESSVLKLQEELDKGYQAKMSEKVKTLSLTPRQVAIGLLKKQQELLGMTGKMTPQTAKIKIYQLQSDEKFKSFFANSPLWSSDKSGSLVTRYDDLDITPI